jgi:hypothetical protein
MTETSLDSILILDTVTVMLYNPNAGENGRIGAAKGATVLGPAETGFNVETCSRIPQSLVLLVNLPNRTRTLTGRGRSLQTRIASSDTLTTALMKFCAS